MVGDAADRTDRISQVPAFAEGVIAPGGMDLVHRRRIIEVDRAGLAGAVGKFRDDLLAIMDEPGLLAVDGPIKQAVLVVVLHLDGRDRRRSKARVDGSKD